MAGDIGDAAMTLGDIVTDNARRFPEVVAYRLDDHSITHAQLYERATRLVSAMVAAGVRRQDRIAILSRNSVEFGEVMAACQLSGIIMATVNFRLTAGEVRDVLNRVRPSILFYSAEFAPMIGDLAAQLNTSPRLVVIGGPARPDMAGYDEFLATGSDGELALRAQPDDIASLIFTSGTTGASKCCILGQRESRRVAFTMNGEMHSGAADRGLINMPMFHIGAIAIIGGVHARGGTVVLQRQFDPDEAVGLIARERISLVHLAPVMLQALLDAVTDPASVAHLRTVIYAAAPMTTGILQRAMAMWPSAGFLNLYGQTEVIVSGLPRELHTLDAGDVLRSVGFPFPGIEVRIVADDGSEVAVGQAGEIVVRADSMFRGYWDDHAATLATLRDGWCHTGDVGRFDARGLLYLVDRKKDVIITGGENVYSPEVEDVVSRIDGVAACAVVGTPDEQWGETVCAVVVLDPAKPDATLTLDTVREYARGRLAGYKLPRRLVVVPELPVLPSGKIDKKRLRAALA
ncbi:AMP-binding protein [Mycolicibacterium sp. XJ1819]